MSATLTQFLMARIEETEHSWGVEYEEIRGPDTEHNGCARRFLADAAAKRQIVRRTMGWSTADPHTRQIMTEIQRYLALPFADHPDYDEAWRP